jgi:hypothetical protein
LDRDFREDFRGVLKVVIGFQNGEIASIPVFLATTRTLAVYPICGMWPCMSVFLVACWCMALGSGWKVPTMVTNMCLSMVGVEILGVGHPGNYQDAAYQPNMHACGHVRVFS